MAKLDHAKRVLQYEILGLLLMALSLVTLGDLGAVGQALDDLCIMLAGNWHFIVPLYLIWMAVITMVRRNRFRYTSFQVGVAMLLFALLVWSELDLYSEGVIQYGTQHPDLLHLTQLGITSLSQSLRVLVITRSTVLPPANAGGGMIGYALFAGLRYLFAVSGTLLILIVTALIALVLMTRKSLVGSIEKGSQFFETRFERGWARTMRIAARALAGSSALSSDRRLGGRADRRRKDGDADGEPAGDGQSGDYPIAGDEAGDEQHPAAKGRRRRRGRAAKHDETPAPEPRLDTVSAEGQAVQAGAFPFPDFGVPYTNDPQFEEFLVGGTVQPVFPLDGGAAERENHAGAGVTVDPAQARVTVRLSEPAHSPLAPDPLPVVAAGQGLTTGVAAEGAKPYRLPDSRLLDRSGAKRGEGAAATRDLQSHAKKLGDTFSSFGVEVRVLGYSRGPTVTRYEIQPAVGVKVARILSLADDLALALAARDIRIEAPIPGKSAIGIEVPNKEISVVAFREVVETDAFTHAKSLLSFALGKDIAGHVVVGDLAKMPHVLVAGATGSGKSVCINGVIASILFRAKPDEVKFIMIDPKMVELGVYNGIPHLFAPVVTEARRAAAALRKVIAEMEHRYELFSQAKVRDLERYNAYAEKQGKRPLPLIVVIIDELADLMMVAPGDVEDAICRLAQMARASGIHLVVATQRPSVDVITGLIKANIPSRIAFSVSSGVDSRTILDSTGAEKLLGRGDMLYLPVGASKPVRLQGAFLSEPEVERLVDFSRRQQEAEYVDDFSALADERASGVDHLDPLFEDAVRLVVEAEQASVSYLQRKLKVGYARAARLVDSLEQLGIVGPFENSKPREVLMTREEWLARQAPPDE
ncbi:MAG: FtsK/SpoIIIE family DNA translocase [Bacilli bacterium]